jgi:hypothetical protein
VPLDDVERSWIGDEVVARIATDVERVRRERTDGERLEVQRVGQFGDVHAGPTL